MDIFGNITKNVGILTQEAKRAYDAKRLELRIKNYHKEETELYTRLGKMLYQTKRDAVNSDGFNAIYDNLDAIKARVRHLDKQITDILNKSDNEEADFDSDGYERLDRKESDLTITRTNEGIRLIRLCPECRAANDPNDTQCSGCQHIF